MKQLLLEAMASGRPSRLDLERATSLDIAVMQLLWVACRESERSGVVLAVEGGVPEAISAAACDAGFEAFPVPLAEDSVLPDGSLLQDPSTAAGGELEAGNGS